MTFSYSIAEGIVWGIISYITIKAGSGKLKDIRVTLITTCPALQISMEWEAQRY
jgi:AGZA family xanthine/uracil permease-like MFS transporter